MDKQKQEAIGASLLFLISLAAVVIIVDWLWRAGLLSSSFQTVYRPVFLFGAKKIAMFRGTYLFLLALLAYSGQKRERSFNRYVILIITLLSTTLFLKGYSGGFPVYNVTVYPMSFVASTFSLHHFVASASSILGNSQRVLDKVATTQKETPFCFSTDKGTLKIPAPTLGIYMEGAAGSGKSVNAKQFLYQAAYNGYAGVFYDFEGNPNEPDGAEISRLIYTALKNSPSTNIKFAFLNFNDLTRSVRVNPVSPKYLKTELDVINVGNTLMKNLEKEWVEKTDFWASNAINVVVGSLLKLRKSTPAYCTIPHLISFILSDFRSVLNYLATDKELEPYIMPVMSAYRQQANQQTAGVISSSQLPLTKLYVPEIYWNFNPPPDEEFNLDITNKLNPSWLCIGNNPKQKQALSPVIALTLSICMEQMNQFDRVKSVFAVDELPTIYIPNLDTLPATARKKGVITFLLVQTFKQLEAMYGKNNAEIIRDNLSNQFIGKTNSYETAERISRMFGEYKKTETSITVSDSGESQTHTIKNEKYLQPKDITQQPTGHWTGFVANADPPFFHARFDEFRIDPLPIPVFRKNSENDDTTQIEDIDRLVKENFARVKQQIDDLLAPYAPADDFEE